MLAEEGLIPSTGSLGDAYNNAAAETIMGLFKNEALAKDSPFRTGALATRADVDEVVLEWCTGTTRPGCTRLWATVIRWSMRSSTTMTSTARYPMLPLVN